MVSFTSLKSLIESRANVLQFTEDGMEHSKEECFAPGLTQGES